MREAAEDEPGVSAVPRGGGSVETETRAAISWSIIASRSAVKAAVPGPRSGSLSRQGATGPEVSRLSSPSMDPGAGIYCWMTEKQNSLLTADEQLAEQLAEVPPPRATAFAMLRACARTPQL